MKGRSCEVCKNRETLETVNRMLAEGATLSSIKARTGIGLMSLSRHKKNHVIAPAQALAAAVAKGKDVAEQRKATLEAAERGDEVAAFLGLEEITRDTRKTSKRLSRAAKATEAAGQFTAMTGVVAQQHKNLELRGKLGGHAGFVPKQLAPGEAMPTFNLTINLPGGVKRISGTPITPEQIPGPALIDASPVIDHAIAGAPDAPEDEPDHEDPDLRKLGRAFGHR
jgi:hypothetical protein